MEEVMEGEMVVDGEISLGNELWESWEIEDNGVWDSKA